MPSLSATEWRRIGAMTAAIVGLHAAGFAVLFAVIVPRHFAAGAGGAFGAGIGITAYVLGLRHAFDADHIATIDNTTRKLIADGKRPLGVGFFFSLGHSTIVFALAALLAVGVRGLGGAVADEHSTLHQAAGLIGPTVSGTFLLLIGAINLVVLVGVVRIFRRVREGRYDELELEAQLQERGIMNRLYARATRAVRTPWHMYPVGLLFGLGFDTATEVALLAAAGAAAAGGLPFYATLCLAVLFAAGMTLLDTIDGVFMNFAYGWALSKPVRKLFYNITITWLSVVVALVVGAIELGSALVPRLGLSGEPWATLAGLDLNFVGYAIGALFLLTWAGALAVWRLARVEERWSPSVEGARE